MIPLDDRGLLLGDGLFETLLAQDGALVDFEAHAARLARGCAVLGLPAPSPGDLLTAAGTSLRERGLEAGRAAVRLTWTAGSGGRGLERPSTSSPRLFATAAPLPRGGQEPARLVTVGVRRNADSPASRLKSLAYLDNVLARREAVALGADEALMLNGRGEVACAAAANLFWFEGAALLTPSLDCGVLDGVVRGRVIDAARASGIEVREVRAAPEALRDARGVFLTNSLIGLRPVAVLDGRPVEPAPEMPALTAATLP